MMTRAISTIGAITLASTTVLGAHSTVVGFDNGDPMGFTGNALFESTGGNPGGNAHHVSDSFFNSLRTGGVGEPANGAFLGDYSAYSEITLSFDIKVDSLTDFIGNPIVRPIGIMLIDRDITGPSGPSGVFYELDPIASFLQPDWTTMSVTIDDPTHVGLPSGWIGFGDEDPNTFAPILPAGASFASVLSSVDEFRVTGAVPGFFFTHAFWDVRIDNVSINAVPGPAGVSLLAIAGVAGMRRRR